MPKRVVYPISGTVQASDGIYICREADEELLGLCRDGEFCYVLTARQMGKSSLMVATRERLSAEGIRSVEIDLTQLGTEKTQLTAEGWYLGLADFIVDQLKLGIDYVAWWDDRARLGLTQRWVQFLRQVVLEGVSEPVVIFIDEIDTTLDLDFTDDFFAAIRSCYNARAADPAFKRLSFVLLGVATPSDLISDPRRTPFNIGEQIGLTDFTKSQAAPLAAGLELPPGEAGQLLGRILDWTGGHPYLTQRLCAAAAASPTKSWDDAAVEEVVEQAFLGQQSAQDHNLRFVRSMLTERAPDKGAVLKTYRRILANRTVPDEERSLVKTHLKLSGIVKAEDGLLRVRNKIYRRVFDLAWVRENTELNWAPIAAAVAIVIALLAVGFIIINYAWVNYQAKDSERRFYGASTLEERREHLARMFEPPGLWHVRQSDYLARQLFFGLSRDEQLDIFEVADRNDPELVSIIQGLYVTLADTDGTGSTTPLLAAMAEALKRAGETRLSAEIESWLEGRELARQGQFEAARTKYDEAIELNANGNNPATLYERARVWVKLGNYQEALKDCDQVMAIAGRAPNPTPTPTPESTAISVATTAALRRVTPATASLAGTQMPASSPIEMSTATPAPIATPEAGGFKSEFATTYEILSAVRILIDANPELGIALVQASVAEYANLREFGLEPTPTYTPLPVTDTPVPATPTETRLQPTSSPTPVVTLVVPTTPLTTSTFTPSPSPTPLPWAVDDVETENNCFVVRLLATALNSNGVGQGGVEFEVGELNVTGSRFIVTTDANGRAAWDNEPGKARTWFVAPIENGQRAGPLVTWQSDDDDVCEVSSAIQIYKITWRRLF